ncbi:GNAT family N-acetyltransferase [Limnochorda pilosa]|uniref:Acetyltransferase n=1 Tax=Limnochorda pilosa TaxID=1555112 RepID=A0A0K2SKB5_LIMPI|nr:GNAT family N-acetyltransferase [Limnochorda pilosa]BAS27556.1 acetyltransferase [Limnochorda pilosa]
MTDRGQRVRLRPLQPQDLDHIVRWTNDPEIRELLEGEYPEEPDEGRLWYQRACSDRRSRQFIIEAQDGTAIGDIALGEISWRAREGELRIRIGEKAYWDQGYGTEAVRALLAYAFEELGFRRVYLRVFTSNRRAIRCYVKSGFLPEGRLVRKASDGMPKEILLMTARPDSRGHRLPQTS